MKFQISQKKLTETHTKKLVKEKKNRASKNHGTVSNSQTHVVKMPEEESENSREKKKLKKQWLRNFHS